jgi:glutamate-1-semialdehyde 2,1-aminomutase
MDAAFSIRLSAAMAAWEESRDDRAFRVLPAGTTRGMTAVFPPLPRVVSGQGFTLHGSEGQQWIDANNNFTSLIHGHQYEPIVKALHEQVDLGLSFGLPTEREVELAELLVARVLWAEQVRFCNSGTEGVMAALRAARAATGRSHFVVMRPAYHGSADHVLPALGPHASHGVSDAVQAESVLIETGSVDALLSVMEARGSQIAAVLIDPTPQRAGGRLLSAEFLRAVRDVTRQHGSLMIADEVVAFRHGFAGATTGVVGIEPDLLVVGKIMGGGLPVGAVLGRRDVMAWFDPRQQGSVFHGGTFSGNPMTMVAGIAAMRGYGQDEVQRLNALGDRMRGRLHASLEAAGCDAIGFGSISQIVSVVPRDQASFSRDLWWAAERRGLIVGPQSLSVTLSTPMTTDTVDEICRCIEEAAQEVAAS